MLRGRSSSPKRAHLNKHVQKEEKVSHIRPGLESFKAEKVRAQRRASLTGPRLDGTTSMISSSFENQMIYKTSDYVSLNPKEDRRDAKELIAQKLEEAAVLAATPAIIGSSLSKTNTNRELLDSSSNLPSLEKRNIMNSADISDFSVADPPMKQGAAQFVSCALGDSLGKNDKGLEEDEMTRSTMEIGVRAELDGRLMHVNELLDDMASVDRGENLRIRQISSFDRSHLLIRKATILNSMRDYKAAAMAAQDAYALNPHSAAALYRLGQATYGLGLLQDAVTCFNRARDLDPMNDAIKEALNVCFMRIKSRKERAGLYFF